MDNNGYLSENELLTLTSMAKGKEPTAEVIPIQAVTQPFDVSNLPFLPGYCF